MSKDTKTNLAIFNRKARLNQIETEFKQRMFEIIQLHTGHSNEIYRVGDIGVKTIAGQKVRCKIAEDSYVRGQETRRKRSRRFFIVGDEFNVGKGY